MKWLLILLVFTFPSCTLLDSLRDESASIDRDLDREQGEAQAEYAANRPRTLNGLSANNNPSFDPAVQRGYGRKLASIEHESSEAGAAIPEFRRATRKDFIDNEMRENSLWDDQGQNNYLFSHNRERQTGDLLTIDIEKELKRDIQYQLWMTLSPEQRKPKKKAKAEGVDGAKPATGAQPATTAKSAEEKGKDEAEEAAKTNLASGGKDDDLVRMEVVENLGNGVVRAIGQKKVIYRGASRVVEVMALVNNKDVDDGNRVKSSAFLDMKTQVIQ